MVSAVAYTLHPDALQEYAEAVSHYATKGGTNVALRFVAEVEAAIATIMVAPESWRIVDAPDIRRYLTHRFPFGLYYRWEAPPRRVDVYAVMHTSRRPGYWRGRLG